MQAVAPALPRGPAPAAFESGPWRDAAAAAVSHAPYLKRLMERRPDLLVDADSGWAERLLQQALATAHQIALSPPAFEEGMRALRRAKDEAHLAAALADLARAWPLMRVTG